MGWDGWRMRRWDGRMGGRMGWDGMGWEDGVGWEDGGLGWMEAYGKDGLGIVEDFFDFIYRDFVFLPTFSIFSQETEKTGSGAGVAAFFLLA